MNEFTELYQGLSDKELLKIIAESEKYNPIAVQTAMKEIETRQIPELELNQVKSEVAQNIIIKKTTYEKNKQRQQIVKEKISMLLDIINPIQKGIQTPEKIIRLTILVFSLLAVIKLHKQIGILVFMLSKDHLDWDISLIELFFLPSLLPIAIYLYWKRKKMGWILLCIFLTYSVLNTIILILFNFRVQTSGYILFRQLVSSVPTGVYIIMILFYSGFLWVNAKQDIRSIYAITHKTMIYTIGLSIAAYLIYVYLIIN